MPLRAQDSLSPYLAPACHKTVALELYQEEDFTAFPCDLGQYSVKPKIWVVGEIHQRRLLDPTISPEEKASVENMGKFWKGVEALAAQGDISILNEANAVALDGKAVGPSFYLDRIRLGDNRMGVEDGFAYASSLFVIIQVSLQGAMFQTVLLPAEQRAEAIQQFRFYLSWMLQLIWYNPYVQQSWAKVDRPFKNPNQERLAKLVDQITCDRNGGDKLEALVNESPMGDLLDMVSLIDLTAGQFAQLLGRIKIHQLELPLKRMAEIMPKINSSDGQSDRSSWQSEILSKTSPVREQLMAVNIAKAYCADLQSGKNRPLVLRVGENHVSGIMTQLKTMAAKSGLDPQLIRTRKPILTQEEGG